MFKSVFRYFVIMITLYGIVYPFVDQSEKKQSLENTVKKTPAITKISKKEVPLHSVSLPSFGKIKDIKLKKRTFFDFIRPHVEKENNTILQHRAQLEIAQMMLQYGEVLSGSQSDQLKKIFKRYKIKDKINIVSINKALVKVDIVPKELALMQAANESAWGTSRFARIGLNFFGQWCYRKGCGMVPNSRDSGAGHEVAAYQSVGAAVKAYFLNINTHRAYASLRAIRAKQRAEQIYPNAESLVVGLKSYSERGEAYVEEISHMIRLNQEYFSE